MIEEIFRGLHNPEFVDKVMAHMHEDAKGFGNYTVALFGEPGTGKFEFAQRAATAPHAAMAIRSTALPSVDPSSTTRLVPISASGQTILATSTGSRANAPTRCIGRLTASSAS